MRAIVTICGGSYRILLNRWLERLRRFTDLPIFVLLLGQTEIDCAVECQLLRVDPSGNPFPEQSSDHACAEKQRIFKHLPHEITEVLFIDIDVLVLSDFWSSEGYFSKSQDALVAAPDLFIGYKEKMECEFQPFDPAFRMKFFSDGRHYYFNTGVFFASRQRHEMIFRRCLETWARYVSKVGRYPSIFDQNVFNYCLITFNVPVKPMPVQNNCLRQYSKAIQNRKVFHDNSEVLVMHFNGGDAQTKLARWLEFEQTLELLP